MLEIKELTKQYGQVYAVDRFNLSVERGQIVGLIGANGSGKTTLLEMIAGLQKSTSGSIVIDGIDAQKFSKELKSLIGYLPETLGVYDDLRIDEYLKFFARAFKIPSGSQKKLIDQTLDTLHLLDQRKAYVSSLSKGMQQRLSLARTLLHDPDFLLLDNPTNGLDQKSRMEFLELVKELQAKGKTIVIASHILSELSEICTDIAIVSQGKLVLQGNIETLISQHKQNKIVQIKPLDEPEKTIAFLEEQNQVCDVKLLSDFIEFEFLGEAEELSHLLRAILRASLPITYFKEIDPTLEDVYEKAVGGITS
ncbi:MAG: ABC transporter ATP-binding protein [Bacillota bacterium]